MSIFDKLKKGINKTEESTAPASQTFTFDSLPESLSEMKALPEADLKSPFATAALTVCALCAYAADREIGCEMLNFLRGPRPLGNHEKSFLNDRFREGAHIPFSYFRGAVPDNGYTPSEPYVIVVNSGPYSDANEGYKKLFIPCGGADNPREIVLRRTSDGRWYLWDQFLMVSIRDKKDDNPWA